MPSVIEKLIRKKKKTDSKAAGTSDGQGSPLPSTPSTELQGYFALGGFTLLFLAQYIDSVSPHDWLSLNLNVLGALPLILSVSWESNAPPINLVKRAIRSLANFFKVSLKQVFLIYLGLALSLAARAAAGDHSLAHSPFYGIFWLLGIGFVVLGLLHKHERNNKNETPKFELLFLVIISTLAFTVRIFNIDQIPYGMTGDEGSTGITAIQFLSGQRNNVQTMAWASYSGLYFWLVSLTQRIFGETVVGIRFLSALGGTLVTLVVYWTAKVMFNRTHAYYSSAIIAVLHFHILFSRVAINNLWDGFFLALMLGGIWIGWQRKDRRGFLIAGVAIGLSQYFYATAHLLPVLALLWSLFLFLRTKQYDRLPDVFGMWLVTLVIIIPLMFFYINHPNELVDPMRRVSILNRDWLQGTISQTGQSAFQIYGRQFFLTLLGYTKNHVRGLYNPQTPMLLPLSSALLYAGVILSLMRIKDPRYFILLAGIVMPVLAGTFSVEAPNAQRLLIAVPSIALLLGIPLVDFTNVLKKAWPSYYPALLTIPILIIIAIGVKNLTFFFYEAMPGHRFSDRGAYLVRSLAEYLQEQPHGTRAFMVIPAPIAYQSLPSLEYVASNIEGDNIDWNRVDSETIQPGDTRTLFIFQRENAEWSDKLKQQFPQAIVYKTRDQNGDLLFQILEINANIHLEE